MSNPKETADTSGAEYPSIPAAGEVIEDTGFISDHSSITPQPIVGSDEMSEYGPIYRTTDAYFRPKSFESTELYEKLGIKFFKEYMPTSGDFVNRYIWRGKLTPMPNSGPRKERVRSFERLTRIYEGMHLGMLACFQALYMSDDTFSHPKSAVEAIIVQAAVNIYPIMLQRYNRIRALHILERKK